MIKRKKGVSPVVATVLLILIVLMVIAMIIFWATKMRREAYTKMILDREMSDRQACTEIRITASYSNNNLEVKNDGNVPVKNFEVEIKKGSEGEERIEAGKSLAVGGIATVSIIPSNIEEINVYPTLLVQGSDGGAHDYKCENSFRAEME